MAASEATAADMVWVPYASDKGLPTVAQRQQQKHMIGDKHKAKSLQIKLSRERHHRLWYKAFEDWWNTNKKHPIHGKQFQRLCIEAYSDWTKLVYINPKNENVGESLGVGSTRGLQ